MNTELLKLSANLANNQIKTVIYKSKYTVGMCVTGKTFEGWIESKYSSRTWYAPDSNTSVSLSDDMAKSINAPWELEDHNAWAIIHTIRPAKPGFDGHMPRFPYYVNLRLRWQRPRKIANSIQEAMKIVEGVPGIDLRMQATYQVAQTNAQKAIGE